MRELLRVVAALLAAALLGYPFLLADGRQVGFVAILAAGAAVNALVLWSDGAATLSAVALGGAYLTGLTVGDVVVDPFAPLYGAVLLLYVETCDAALGVPPLRAVDPALVRRLLASAAWALVVGILAGAVVLGAGAAVPREHGLLRLLAMAGLALAVGVPVLLRESRGRGRAGVR